MLISKLYVTEGSIGCFSSYKTNSFPNNSIDRTEIIKRVANTRVTAGKISH